MTLKKRHDLDKSVLRQALEALFDDTQYIRHEPIGKYMTNKLGGIAEHIVLADNTGAVLAAAKAAIEAKEPYIVVAHGTGSLVSEVGFPGLVIINRTSNIAYSPSASEALVDSGVSNAELVNMLAGRGFGSLEFLAAIPGSIGGAVATNASWGGKSILSYVKELIMYVADAEGGKVVSFTAKELPSAGSAPMFPNPENSPIILSVRLQLAQIAQDEIMRRIAQIRKLGNVDQRSISAVGYFITPSLSGLGITLKDLKELDLAKGIHFSKNCIDLLEFRADNSPEQLRQAVGSIATLLRQNGAVLDERLAYLGYWPSKEDHSITSDTESF